MLRRQRVAAHRLLIGARSRLELLLLAQVHVAHLLGVGWELGWTLLVGPLAGAASRSVLRDGGVLLGGSARSIGLAYGQDTHLLLVGVLVHIKTGDEVRLVYV